MNKFKKFFPNVWVAECEEEYEKGEIIELETKYGKSVECEVHNLVAQKNGLFYYSIVRLEEQTYAQRKAGRYNNSAINHMAKSEERLNASNEGREFLSLGEPIKVGHHSEKRHRALIERNWNRMEKSMEYAEKAKEAERKAEYWENKADETTLAMPESLEYFNGRLEKAIGYHEGLKNGTIERTHSYSLTYAKKDVNELKKKVEIAELLWGRTDGKRKTI
ncbi:DUF3560 domain-containing protein [Paenibacillus donghaensis]|uniref:DUF3560 domain-containing protein n=1 Tax=Paenibacillus donghaensis TaxID=414771 RepID=A0A2Z2KD91_9BACL|nr:DUF3560 domain-containing protein [Paenibacillus donghaensis]ASA20973.1 hypothetical protein B9T62_09350 [Paenibacillus donghaensis]